MGEGGTAGEAASGLFPIRPWGALQKGLAPALLYQFLMNGIRLGTYGLAEAGGYLHTAEGTLNPVRSAAAGALAGVMGAYLGSPIYMVRRRVLPGAFQEDPWCRVGAWVLHPAQHFA